MASIPFRTAPDLNPPLTDEPPRYPNGDEVARQLANIQRHLDEAYGRKADNDLVEGWRNGSRPFFDGPDDAADAASLEMPSVLDAEIARQRAALGNGAQRRMFDGFSANRREEWLSDVLRHRDAAQARYDRIRSGYRPLPATGQSIGNLAAQGIAGIGRPSSGNIVATPNSQGLDGVSLVDMPDVSLGERDGIRSNAATLQRQQLTGAPVRTPKDGGYLLSGMQPVGEGSGSFVGNLLHYAGNPDLAHDMGQWVNAYGAAKIASQMNEEVSGDPESIRQLAQIARDNSSSELADDLEASIQPDIVVKADRLTRLDARPSQQRSYQLSTGGFKNSAEQHPELGSFEDILGKYKAMPYTLIGTVIGGGNTALGWLEGNPNARVRFGSNSIQFVGGGLAQAGPGGTFYSGPRGGAFTLGNVQVYGGDVTPRKLDYGYPGNLTPVPTERHEKQHTYQYQDMGIAFLPIYMSYGLQSPGNPFEQAADRGARGGSPYPYDLMWRK